MEAAKWHSASLKAYRLLSSSIRAKAALLAHATEHVSHQTRFEPPTELPHSNQSFSRDA